MTDASGGKAATFHDAKSLFNAVIDLPPAERAAILRALCDDAALIAEVEAIIAQSDAVMTGDPNDLLATPIGAVAEAMVGSGVAAEPAELKVGDVVGVWKLQHEVGRGGMGSVYLVERIDGHFTQRAALKLLQGYVTPRAVEHLARERQILAGLQHPHIARLLDGGATPRGRPYLVLEYVEGQPIDAHCRSQNLSRESVLRLFVAVCRAVAFAHRELIVHCDLKPSNVLVNARGEPVLLDFGVSRLITEASAERAAEPAPDIAPGAASHQTLTQAAFTPRYASPEQLARGQLGRITIASDVYSLGLMLAELLGMRLKPMKDETAQPANVDTGAWDAMVPSVASLATLALSSPDLAAIVVHATAPTPATRYNGADAIADDIERLLSHRPVAARAPTPTYVAGKFVRRHWPAVTAGAAFVVVVLGFSWHTMRERDAARQAERATREVKDYMVSVFQGADPEVTGQRDLPVSKLLDAGRERLGVRLKDLPQTRVEMTGILASVYQNIGQRDQALTMFDEAIALERKAPRPLVLAELLGKKAYSLYDKEDFPAAEPFAREALALVAKAAPGTMQEADAMRLLGAVLAYQQTDKAWAEAGPLLRRALDMTVALTGARSKETGRAHLDLTRLYASMSDVSKAEVHALAGRDILAETVGREHYLYLDALESVGFVKGAKGALDEALPILKEMSEKRSALYGEVSNQNGFGLYAYANILARAGLRREAADIFRRCIAIQEKLDGRATLSTAIPMLYLGRVQAEMGLAGEALPLLREVLSNRQKLLPPGDSQIQEAMQDVAQALRALGQMKEAEATLVSLAQLRAKVSGGGDWAPIQSALLLAAIQRETRRPAEAQATLEKAVDKMKPDTKPARIASLRAEQGRLALASGQPDNARRLFTEAESLTQKGLGETHPDTWLAKLDRAELMMKTPGERDAAQLLARQIRDKAAAALDARGALFRRVAKIAG